MNRRIGMSRAASFGRCSIIRRAMSCSWSLWSPTPSVLRQAYLVGAGATADADLLPWLLSCSSCRGHDANTCRGPSAAACLEVVLTQPMTDSGSRPGQVCARRLVPVDRADSRSQSRLASPFGVYLQWGTLIAQYGGARLMAAGASRHWGVGVDGRREVRSPPFSSASP